MNLKAVDYNEDCPNTCFPNKYILFYFSINSNNYFAKEKKDYSAKH